MKLISWNVNGIRSVLKKGFLDFLNSEQPDLLCVQETKAAAEDVPPETWPEGYHAFWNAAEKKGYSGVLTLCRQEPISVSRGMNLPPHDQEGRVLTLEFPDFYSVNVYVPNSKRELTRLPYRQEWDRDFLAYLRGLEKTKPVIVCGDMNVAHAEIDLARPKDNVKNHGFTVEERAGFTALVDAGFVDTFREFQKDGGHYTWWSQMGTARARNIGWRIDYFVTSGSLRPQLKGAKIYPEVRGSDHCPIGLEMKKPAKK